MERMEKRRRHACFYSFPHSLEAMHSIASKMAPDENPSHLV